jgi:uncharacterized protein (TIRG00374 family)
VARRWLLWLLALGFAWVVFSHLPEIETLLETLARGRWQWVLAAALLQAVFYTISAEVYRSAFDAVGVGGRTRDLLAVLIASYFVNALAPSGGMAGSALFVGDAARRGQSGARAAAGTILARVADTVAFTVVLTVGFVYLYVRHDLRTHEITGAVVLLLSTTGLSVLLLLGLSRAGRLRGVLGWMQQAVTRLAARLRWRTPFSDDWAEHLASEFVEAGGAIRARPLRLVRTVGLALAAHLVDLASLYTIFLAFHQPVAPGLLTATYGMGILFWKMSPVPEGIGVVEGVMALTMTSLGVPAATATVVTLSFRGLTFWLPLAFGFFTLRRLPVFQAQRMERAD